MKKKKFVYFIVVLELILCSLAVFSIVYNSNIGGGISLFAVALVILLFCVINYNILVKYKNKIKESFALIDIQLKLRFDLVPNLVKIVKAHSKYEKDTLSELTRLRELATTATTEEEKLEHANKMVPQIRNLIAVAEDSPKLKSSALYKSLMEQLGDIEDRLVAARRIYDSNVNIYNTSVETFPTNLIAKIFGFEREKLFKIDAGENISIKID